MKKTYLFIKILAIALSFSSCNGILSEEDYNAIKGIDNNSNSSTDDTSTDDTFQINYLYSAYNDKIIYFSNNNELISIDLSTSEQTTLKTFSANISFLDYKNQYVYLSEGNRLWKYSIEDNSFVKIYTTTSTIYMFYVLDNYIVVNDNSGAWSTNYLIRLSDSVVLDSDEWQYRGKSYVYYNKLNRIYHFRNGISPDDICYNTIDYVNEKFAGDGDGPYHGDYSLGSPLKISPDESIVFTSSGNAFNANDLTFISMTPLRYIDMCFKNEKIYLLSLYNQLLVYNNDSTYTFSNNVKTYSDTPKKIYLSDEAIYVVLETSDSKIKIDSINLF